MNTYPECIACLFNQAIQAQKIFSLTDEQTRDLMNTLGTSLSRFPEAVSPPVIATVLQHRLEDFLDSDDPYREIKNESSNRILEFLDEIRHVISSSPDPLKSVVLLAIGGNAIDYGVFGNQVDIERVITDALHSMEDSDDSHHSLAYEEWKEHLNRSSKVLYVVDNAGEVVFDRLLIETMKKLYPELHVTVAVRNRPIINDVTLEDARFAGIDLAADAIIPSGCDGAGLVIGEAGEEMNRIFGESDIIISKGQGNFEAMSEAVGPIYFFLKVKCPVVSRETAQPIGTYLLMKAAAFR